eukprot:3377650-Pleurochrysis_carterae.AAC.1
MCPTKYNATSASTASAIATTTATAPAATVAATAAAAPSGLAAPLACGHARCGRERPLAADARSLALHLVARLPPAAPRAPLCRRGAACFIRSPRLS